MSGASDILRAGTEGELWGVIDTLDRWGFALFDTRISVWRAIVALAVIVAALLLARLTIRIIGWFLGKMHGIDDAQQLLARKLVSIAVWTITFLLTLDILGIDLTALAVFSGAFGLALGFGVQKTFGNLLAGIILLMDRSIKPGDVIAVNDGISNTRGSGKSSTLGAPVAASRSSFSASSMSQP